MRLLLDHNYKKLTAEEERTEISKAKKGTVNVQRPLNLYKAIEFLANVTINYNFSFRKTNYLEEKDLRFKETFYDQIDLKVEQGF